MSIGDIIGGSVSAVLVSLWGVGLWMFATGFWEKAFTRLAERAEAMVKEYGPQIQEMHETAKKPCECAQYKCQPCKARMVLGWWADRDKEREERKRIPWYRRPRAKFETPPWTPPYTAGSVRISTSVNPSSSRSTFGQ